MLKLSGFVFNLNSIKWVFIYPSICLIETRLSSKLLVVIATGERAKALTGLMYAKNAIKHQWLDDVKVVYFGPSEQLIYSDPDVANAAIELASIGESYACKAISDRDGISEKIDSFGVRVEYVGSIISEHIKQGYVPMVW